MRARTTLIGCNVAVVALSLLTGLKVLPGPDIIGVALAFYTLIILPGYCIDRLLFGPAGSMLERVCRLFCSGLIFSTVLVCLGFLPGITFLSIAVAAVAVDIALLLLAEHRRAEPADRRRPRGEQAGKVLLVSLIFAACFVLFYGTGELDVGGDSLDHLSFIRRSLESGEIFPHDSFYRDGDGAVLDPRKGLLHPVVALWSFLADAPPEFLWMVIPSFFACFAAASFFLFADTLLGSTWLAACALLFLVLFYRGEGICWFTKLGFSRNVAQIVLWCEVALLLRFYHTGERRYLWYTFFMALAGTAYHLVYGLLLAAVMLGLFILVRFTASYREWRGRFLMSLPLQAGAVLIPLGVRARYTFGAYNLVHMHRQGMLLLTERLAVVDPLEVVSRVGLVFFYALLISPFIFRISPAKKQQLLVGVLFLVPAILILNPFTAVLLDEHFGYLHYRLLYAAPLMCLLALGITGLLRFIVTGTVSGGRAVRQASSKPDRRVGAGDRLATWFLHILKRGIGAVFVLLFVFYPLRYAAQSFEHSVRLLLQERGQQCLRYGELVDILDEHLPAHSVVVSDPRTSYALSAFTDHYVVVTLDQHCSPTDTLALERLLAVDRMMSPARPLRSCLPWLRRFGADYVLLNKRMGVGGDFFVPAAPGETELTYQKFSACEELLREISATDSYVLFKVDRDAVNALTSCDTVLSHTLSCEGWIHTAGGSSVPATNDEPAGETGAPREPSPDRKPVHAGAGILLTRIGTDGARFEAGGTMTVHLCWHIAAPSAFGLPLEWTLRLDTDFPKGAFYRSWYSKLYRRSIERRNQILYRYTDSGRVRSGFVPPDQWVPGADVRQDIRIALPLWLARGRYTIRIKVRRASFVTNRTLGDYFRHEDSLRGEAVARVEITVP